MKKKLAVENKTLRLSRETLRALKQRELPGIVGGHTNPQCSVSLCAPTCPTC